MGKMSGKWCLKCCPSCGGDMFLDEFRDLKCLQCGRSVISRTTQERAQLKYEVEHGRKVRLPG